MLKQPLRSNSVRNRVVAIFTVAFAITSLGLAPALAVDERVIDIVSVRWAGSEELPATVNQLAVLINTEVNASWKAFTKLEGDTKDRTISFVSGKVLGTPLF